MDYLINFSQYTNNTGGDYTNNTDDSCSLHHGPP